MNLWLWIARSVAATILGLLIFVSFLSFFLVSNITGKVLDDATYTQILSQQDTYNRLYDEVLPDPRLSRITSGLIGNIQLVSHLEIASIIRRIAPPDFLQAEVEKNLRRAIEYFKGERATLELEIDVRELLPRVEINIFEYIDRLIDQLDTVDIDTTRDPAEQFAEVEELINAMIWDLATGRTPEAVPAIGFIPASQRAIVFDSLLPSVLNDPRIDRRVSWGLHANVIRIRSEFIAGDTRQFLKEVAHAGLTPLIDQGIVDFNRYLDEQGNLDLIAIAVENSDGLTEETVRYRLDRFRDQFRRGATLGGSVAQSAAIVATVAMSLIYLPSLINAMRWPGLTLLLTGMVLFGLGKLMENTLPGLINALVEEQISKVSDLPPSAAALANDLARQFILQLFTGLANPALILLLIGAVLFAGSFLVRQLRPAAPWIR
jgi:uncharacterized membrane protein YgdD (TMEM256/DUF423 family)